MTHVLGGSMTGILATIKKMIGLDPSYTQFDTDLIIFINSAIATLRQLGVGPDDGFQITGYEEDWDDLLINEDMEQSAKEYIYLKVRRLFDPPSNSTYSKVIDEEIKELEWRLNVTSDIGEGNE